MQTPAVSDAPLTATLGETIQHKAIEGDRPADALWGDDTEPSGWRELLSAHPYVALGAAAAVGVIVTMWWRRR